MQGVTGKIFYGRNIPAGEKAFTALAGETCHALNTYPYYCIVRGYEGEADIETVKSLLRTVANNGVALSPGQQLRPPKVSFTRVRINSSTGNSDKKWTAYSRTNQTLGLHTDSSYNRTPHRIIAFHMSQPAQSGGETLLAPLDDILQHLPQEMRLKLGTSRYPFADNMFPVLAFEHGAPAIRFFRHQIEQSLAQGNFQRDEQVRILDTVSEFERFVTQPPVCTRFFLQKDDLLVINNWRVLHGRTAFSSDSQRLMFRYRIHSPLTPSVSYASVS